jgi:hypothetical protein
VHYINAAGAETKAAAALNPLYGLLETAKLDSEHT